MQKILSRKQYILIDLALLVAVIIWGSTFIMIKDELENLGPVSMLVYRFFCAAFLVGIYLKFKKIPLFVNFSKGALVGLCLWLVYVPQNIGMLYTTASNSGFITALFVAFVPLFSIAFFRRWPSAVRIFAALLSLVGLWFLTGGFSKLNRGDLITLISPFACALFVLFTDQALKKNGMSPLVLCFQQFLTAGILSLVWILVSHEPFVIHGIKTWLVIGYLSVFATALTFCVTAFVQKLTSPMKVTLIFALEPVFAAFFACVWGNESFGPMQAIGGVLMVLATIISETPREKIFSLFRTKQKQIDEEGEEYEFNYNQSGQ